MIASPSQLKNLWKTKENSVVTPFHDKDISPGGFYYICIVVTLIDFVFKKDKDYYPQALTNVNTL